MEQKQRGKKPKGLYTKETKEKIYNTRKKNGKIIYINKRQKNSVAKKKPKNKY
jgi:hypothetical protein